MAVHDAGPRRLFTSEDIRALKAALDRTCEELGVFIEDEEARRRLGRTIVMRAAAEPGAAADAAAPSVEGPLSRSAA